MKENVFAFGEGKCLLGVLSDPESQSSPKESIGILFLNAGVLHHVGPNRLWVDMGRLFAEQGFVSLRFDLAGFGDSLNRRTQQSYEQRSILDIQEAMDFLDAKKGIKKFVLIGFCSGAENAHHAALADDRIVGAVFMDGYAYRTVLFFIKRSLIILSNPLKILKFIVRKIISLPGYLSQRSRERDQRKDIFASELPPKQDYLNELQRLIDRKVAMLFLFSKGMAKHYNYHRQFYDMFKTLNFDGMVNHIFFHEADHMYTLLETRETLMNHILQWLRHVEGKIL